MENSPFNRFSQTKPIIDFINKQRENERFIKTLEVTATFVLIIFFIFFAIRPTALTISALLGDIESKKILKKELNKKINNIIMAQDLFSQVEGQYSVINNSLPDRPNYYDAVNQIKSNCLDGCSLGQLSFNFETNKGAAITNNSRTYSVNVNTHGSFASAVDLASKVLQNQRLANIESIQFTVNQITSPGATQSASGQLGTNFNTVFYYWPTNP